MVIKIRSSGRLRTSSTKILPESFPINPYKSLLSPSWVYSMATNRD
jgi:hypothetical protein